MLMDMKNAMWLDMVDRYTHHSELHHLIKCAFLDQRFKHMYSQLIDRFLGSDLSIDTLVDILVEFVCKLYEPKTVEESNTTQC